MRLERGAPSSSKSYIKGATLTRGSEAEELTGAFPGAPVPAPLQLILQILPRVALLLLHNLRGWPGGDDLAARITAFGADVDDPVRRADVIQVLLDCLALLPLAPIFSFKRA